MDMEWGGPRTMRSVGTAVFTPARAYLPLLVLPLVVVSVRGWMEPWQLMSSMAAAIFTGCKWLTLADEWERGGPADVRRAVLYLLTWPGMDARAFLRDGDVPRPSRADWRVGLRRAATGMFLIWVPAPWLVTKRPLLGGWIVMIGLVLFLHFGTFALVSTGWRHASVNARPLMNRPMHAASLADFWGRRWNVAFHHLASRYLFQPLRPRIGSTRAMLLVFLLSGLIHELAISLPASGGYGLPTMYFVVQGLGLAGERSRTGKRLGLGRGRRGWIFMALVTAVPAFWLFPPVFVHRVIVPMVSVIGARE